MSAAPTIKFRLKTSIDDARPVYITGNFNKWNPRDENFRMVRNDDGTYQLEIADTQTFPENVEYKYTKGGWENVEIDRYGNIHGNRKLPADQKNFIEDEVELFRNNWAPYKQEFFPIAELISDNFDIPQLDKTRRIWALLPYDCLLYTSDAADE